MKKKGLLTLSLVTVAAVAAAGFALRGRGATDGPPEAGGRLLGELGEHVNDVVEIEITKDGELSTLRREDEGWVLVERNGYAALFDRVKELIVQLAELEIEEPKTSRPENHARLGVEAPEAEGSEAARVVLLDAGGQRLGAVIVGNTVFRRGSQAVFARREGEDRTYLCAGRLDLRADPKSWIDAEILRLDSERVQDVSVVHADGEEVTIGRSRENHTQFVVNNVPPEREERFDGVANSVATALSVLSLDEVRPLEEVDFAVEPVARTRFRCHDGLIIEIETARFEDGNWARLQASYEAPEAPAADEPATEEAPPADTEALRAEAQELAERFERWAYALPDYKVDVIARRMEDLLAEVAVGPSPTAEPFGLSDGEALDLSGEAPEVPAPAPDDSGDGDESDG